MNWDRCMPWSFSGDAAPMSCRGDEGMMLVEMDGWPWASCEVPKTWMMRVQFLLSFHHTQMVVSYLSSYMDACWKK